jgi:NAD(P)-dependent dehydrogenase (short-subunit alcohol dehydrogenase family)
MVEFAHEMAGKATLVTGAGSGLGRAVALMLAGRGAQVCIVDIGPDRLAETAALWPPDAPAPLLHPADLSDPDACAPAVAAAVEGFGRLDALCNVAGVIHLANTPDMPRAQWDRTMAVNLTAPFLLAQAAIPHLL